MYGRQLFLPVLLLPPELLENPIGGFSPFQSSLGKVRLEEVEPTLVLVNLHGKPGPDRAAVHVPPQQDQTNQPTVLFNHV